MLFRCKKRKNAINKVIPSDLTDEWIRRFKSKYSEIRNITEHINFGDNMALYCFLYIYLSYEFKDLTLQNQVAQIKKYIHKSVFFTTNPKKILTDIDNFIDAIQYIQTDGDK